MSAPSGFAYSVRKGGDIAVTHHGWPAGVLRGRTAARFLDDLAAGREVQELLARLTGNYRRGNERAAGHHARNADPG